MHTQVDHQAVQQLGDLRLAEVLAERLELGIEGLARMVREGRDKA